ATTAAVVRRAARVGRVGAARPRGLLLRLAQQVVRLLADRRGRVLLVIPAEPEDATIVRLHRRGWLVLPRPRPVPVRVDLADRVGRAVGVAVGADAFAALERDVV